MQKIRAPPAWPERVRTSWAVCAFQILIVPSSDALTNSPVLGRTTRLYTALLWPARTRIVAPVRELKTRMLKSGPPAPLINSPLGSTARETTWKPKEAKTRAVPWGRSREIAKTVLFLHGDFADVLSKFQIKRLLIVYMNLLPYIVLNKRLLYQL